MLYPFFSYFGSKFRLSKHYSAPVMNMIIEPFSGSAGYSLMYPDKEVILYDSYEPIVSLWKYLITVSEKDILSLPVRDFVKENSLEDEMIPQEAKTLIGFWLTESQTSASKYPLSKSRGGGWDEKKKQRIAKQLQYIRHWRIEHKSYENIDCNPVATWFIDPPYKDAGKRYRHNKIDYANLAKWSQERNGHVIVCEQDGADWMDFKLLRNTKNASNKAYAETIWEKFPYEQWNFSPTTSVI